MHYVNKLADFGLLVVIFNNDLSRYCKSKGNFQWWNLNTVMHLLDAIFLTPERTVAFSAWSCLVMKLHRVSEVLLSSNGKVKVHFTLEQAMKTQRGSRGIALIFI